MLGNNFYMSNAFFLFFTIYFIEQNRHFLCLNIDHSPLIILKFMFETFSSYYFLNSLILLLKVS